MRTELRFLLAVVLMFVVLIGTNLLFPPAAPEETAVPEGAVSDSVAAEQASDVGSASAPEVPRVPPGVSPGAAPDADAPGVEADVATPDPERRVRVEGPLYDLEFSTYGARLVAAELPLFQALNREGVVDLIPEGSTDVWGQRLVVGTDTLDLERTPFRVEPQEGLRLSEGGAPQDLRFVAERPEGGFGFEIVYTFDPELYLIGVSGRVEGLERPLLLTSLGEGLAFAEADSADEARMMAYVQNHLRDGIDSTPLSRAEPAIVPGPLVWAAFRSKFFVMAMLAGASDEAASDADYLGGLIVAESALPERPHVTAAQSVGNDGRFQYRLFAGPQEYARLSSLGQGMEEVNPYGWRFFRPIIRPFVSIIMAVLVFLHTNLSIGYGWVLVVFGVAMRVVLWPLNQKAMKAQLRNMAVQPLVQDIQKQYKDNPERLQKEMMRLYKEHGFNPLAGCVPMLLPWPVLIALFFVFQNTIELRGVPFLWLPDLSARDPLYILPILLAVSMFLMQWVSLRSLDQPNPQMKMMMWLMPGMMLFIFMNLASGLNLYYATANIATIPQQVWIANERKKMKGRPPPKLSSD
ncbi:MAG TPA: membrane protein insertase YidC [Longimicrobiales bacterium]|nr:membrane protein insertase YidC [Longimicrobiales bacterium]